MLSHLPRIAHKLADVVQILHSENHAWSSILYSTVVGNSKYNVGEALFFFILSRLCMLSAPPLRYVHQSRIYSPASLIHSWRFLPSPYALIADREPSQLTVLRIHHGPIDEVRRTARPTCGPSYLSNLYLLGRTTVDASSLEPGLYPVIVARKLRKSKYPGSKSNGNLTVSGMIEYHNQHQRRRTKTLYQRIANAPPVKSL